MNGNDNLSTKLPVFDGKIWNRWMIQMRVLFCAQNVIDIVNDDYISVALLENATNARGMLNVILGRRIRRRCSTSISVWM